MIGAETWADGVKVGAPGAPPSLEARRLTDSAGKLGAGRSLVMSTSFIPARCEAVRLLTTGAAVNFAAMSGTLKARTRKITVKQN